MEIDHIFICVNLGAREAEALKEFGLVEGGANKHPGQGTSNRRFFFRNAFIELLYLSEPAEAQSELTKPTKLYERLTCKSNRVSPFGICFRPAQDSEGKVPFSSWRYQPAYLPADIGIDIGHAPLEEPMWFFSSFTSRPDKATSEKRQPFEHPIGFRELTSLRVTVPNTENYSEPALYASGFEKITLSEGAKHLLQIGFDGEISSQLHDFQPLLPLVFRW